jgi:hypothetical protein
MSHRKELLIMLVANYLLNGEDMGVTSYEAQEYLECNFGISRASNILRQMYANRLLKRKLEVFPSGGRRYRYYLASDGKKKGCYFYMIRHPEIISIELD